MIGLPEFGTRVRVWPRPGRLVQDGPRPVDRLGGGRWMPTKGLVVEWDAYRHQQLLAGDLLLHHPPCEEHEFGNDKDDECGACGRTKQQAADYDAHAKPARARAAAQSKAPVTDAEWSHAKATDDALAAELKKALEDEAAKAAAPVAVKE